MAVAQLDVNASSASAAATRAAGQRRRREGAPLRRTAAESARTAAARLVRAERTLVSRRRLAELAALRLRVLSTPGDTSLQQLAESGGEGEARGTAGEVARLARKIGIQVPADEVLFFPTLPLRVDSVRVRRGDSVSGRVMTVSNSRLAIDSSLSLSDAKLVRPGARVGIEEPDLGDQDDGVVTQVADRPGTHKVDRAACTSRSLPGTAPAQLVGASVKLTIAVKSTDEAVLTVPVTALSVGADGSSRAGAAAAARSTSVEPGSRPRAWSRSARAVEPRSWRAPGTARVPQEPARAAGAGSSTGRRQRLVGLGHRDLGHDRAEHGTSASDAWPRPVRACSPSPCQAGTLAGRHP